MLVSQGTHFNLETLCYALTWHTKVVFLLFWSHNPECFARWHSTLLLKGRLVPLGFKAMFSVLYLDVSDNSRKVGRCHQKECWGRGSVADCASPDLGWSSSSSWRPWTGAGELGCQDSATGQSICFFYLHRTFDFNNQLWKQEIQMHRECKDAV